MKQITSYLICCIILGIFLFVPNMANGQSESVIAIEKRIINHLSTMLDGNVETNSYSRKSGHDQIFIIIELPNKQEFHVIQRTVQDWIEGYGDMFVLENWSENYKSEYRCSIGVRGKVEGIVSLYYCGDLEEDDYSVICMKGNRLRITIFGE